MDLFLLRLGTGEKYTLNPDKKRFLIGRNNSCDFTFTSPHISRKHCEILRVPPRGTLIIKNLKLKSVDNFAELRIGCKIGLGVPLSQTQGDGVKNDKFVFLRLCDAQAEEQSYVPCAEKDTGTEASYTYLQKEGELYSDNEKLQQHLADLSYSGPSAAVQDSIPHADPQKCGPAQQAGPQNQTMPGVRLTPQPGPARQAIQELPGLLNLLKSHTNVTSDSAPTSLLQNTDTKPFTSTPLPQVIHPIPPLQKLHPSTYQSLSWAQNRIQEPLSELHLQSTYNEDHSHTDRQRLHSVNTPSAAPNNVQPAKTFGGAPYKSELWEKVDALKATHSEYNPQPGLCQVQRDQQVCETSHGPCKRILSKKDHDESVPGKLQRLGAVYGDYVGTSQQNNSKQINLLNSQLKEGGADPSQLQVFNRSALGEYTQTQKPDNKSRHQGEGPGAVMCEHSLGMEHLGNTHSSDHHQSVPLMLSSSVEKRLQSPMEDGNQQEKVSVSVEAPQSVCSLLTESGSSQSPSRIFSQFKQTSEDSRVALSLNKDLAPLVHVSNWKQIRRHSRDVLPQSVIPDDSQIEHTSQHGNGLQTTKTSEEFNLIIQQSSSKLKVISEKKLALNCSNIDQTTKVQQFSSSTRRDSMTDKLVSSNVSSCNIDPNCKQSVVDSCDKQDAAQLNMSLEQQAVVTQEKQRDLFNKSPVFTRKDNKHYIIEDNNKQTNRNLAALPLGSQQFSNVDTRSKESCNPADGLVSPCSIDLTQTDPEHTEESDNASDDNIENWIHNKDKHVKYENVDDIVFICDSKEDSSSVENQNFSGKRNITIHEEINVDDDSNKGQHSESIKSESDVQVVDLGSTCDSELLLQHRKTKKRSLVINSDSSSDSFSVEKKDFSGKRKRSIHEEIYVDFCDIDSNKGHHSKSIKSESDVQVVDLISTCDSELLLQHRKTKKRRSLVIDSDSNSSNEADINSKTLSSREPVVFPSLLEDCLYRKCVVAVERVPYPGIYDVDTVKTSMVIKSPNLTVNCPLSQTSSHFNETCVNTPVQKSYLTHDDDDDELPDIDIFSVPKKILSCSPLLSGSSECKELKKHKENKSINLVKGSQGKDKEDVTDSKKHITGRKHRQSDSYDSSDTKQDKDVHKYKKQTLCSTRDIPEKKNPSTMGTEKNDPPSDKGYSKSHSVLSCTSTGTGIDNISENLSMPSVSRKTKISESEPTVLRTRGEQDAVSDATCPNVFDKSKLLLNVAIKQEKTEEAQVKDIKIKKEKGEEDGVLIKKEKGEEDGVLIKKEFDQNLNAVDEDGDNDGVIFMYSQVDETIWVSSDEEESPSQNDISFGPLPRSPDLDIDELFREDEEQKLRQNASGISTNSTPEEAVTDDQWFPILSQSFFDDDDDFVNQPVESAKGPALPEPLPGPSGLNEMTEDNDESIGEWWPELSQQFFDDDLDNSKIHGASKSDVTLSGSSKNLDTVIEKLRNTNKRRSQLTDPKLPPTRTKSDNLRRRGKSCQEFYGKHYRYNEDNLLSTADRRDETGVRGERISRERKSRKDSSWKRVITPPQKQKCKKGSALRANLTSKFNLVSYKATVEHKPREKHHLVPKIKVENKEKKVEEKQKEAHQKKREAHQKKSHLVTDRPRAGENISIQKKTERKDSGNQEKPRPKVAAKVTKKTRSERLIDVDLFTALAVPTPKPQKLSFKIPKNCDKTVDKMIKSLSGSVSAPSTSVGSSLVLVKPSAGELDTNPPPRVEPEMRVGTENIDGDTTLLLQPPVLKEQIVNKSEKEQKGILKFIAISGSTQKKKVHFPTRLEDLVDTLHISPRKNHERTGALEVKAREVLPMEVVLQKYHISSNYMDQFIHHICRWNYDWLEVYRAGQVKQETSGKGSALRPPPVALNTNYPTLILYNSYSDYKEIFSNLMYLEIWESVYQDWLKYKQSNVWLPTQIDVFHPDFIEIGTGSLKFWKLKMFTLITQDQSFKGQHPRQGSLISLRIQEGAKKIHIFGHVDHFMKHRKVMVTKELQQACPNGEVCLMMGVRVTKDVIQKATNGKLIMISNVSYIRPSTRMWEGLCKLPLSPLCEDILQPSKDVFMGDRMFDQYLVNGLHLNDVQKKAVVEVSNKCVSNYHIPKMSLIHGPPGTGKTRTIVGLIAQMVQLCCENGLPVCRILLCAPSNAAVDELTLRLIRLREIGICLRVVRVCSREVINPEIKNCTLDSFVEKQIKVELSTPQNPSTKQEWERRKAIVEEAATSLQNAMKGNRSKEEIRQMEIRLTELVRSRTDFERSFHTQPTAQEKHQLQQKWQQKILLNAEVITTTLGGCLSGIMSDVFCKKPNNFTCCIIDEAGQCKETETWLPLLLGVRKLVLVGDHRQLPATVLSRLAQVKNLKQSLFERLYHRFVIELQLDSCVHTLSIQYRMHPEIAMWPSLHFYSGRLTTSADIIQERTSDLKPYVVFDLKTSQEQRDQNHELYNPKEAALVRCIIETLEPQIGKQKIGIITPYQRQKILLEGELAKFFGRMNIVINTIDAFQGQERDIIILSFVRANSTANIGFLSHRQRLNVALTRARKCCYIVTSLSSFSGNQDWLSLIKNAESRGLVHAITNEQKQDKNYIINILQK
ncbi:uncharacterized protein LOC121857375 isoform X2 [Homarus americanus]|uniref:uncharacterized protein LOC121857375 isoform X2 n=1 Tax=Homarus americanus TaxID=6706 RepID=UPI001C437DCB|nr:uncharacterized protein LOC121857375 isoform X2 [Homarus americanus]